MDMFALSNLVMEIQSQKCKSLQRYFVAVVGKSVILSQEIWTTTRFLKGMYVLLTQSTVLHLHRKKFLLSQYAVVVD